MTTINENPMGTNTTEEFADQILGAIDSASVAILLSIGHQTRLFDTMAELEPASSAEIADAAVHAIGAAGAEEVLAVVREL